MNRRAACGRRPEIDSPDSDRRALARRDARDHALDARSPATAFTQMVWSRASTFVSHAVTLTYMSGPITKKVARGFDQVTLSSPAQTQSMFEVLMPQDVDPAGRPGAVVQVGGCRG